MQVDEAVSQHSVVLAGQVEEVEPDEPDALEEGEDSLGVAFSRHVGKNVGDLSFNVTSIAFEEPEQVSDDVVSAHELVYLVGVAGCDVRNDPAGFGPDYFFIVL